jgi:hypothetical protein
MTTLNLSHTNGRFEYANFLTAIGRFEESIEIGRRTLLPEDSMSGCEKRYNFARRPKN